MPLSGRQRGSSPSHLQAGQQGVHSCSASPGPTGRLSFFGVQGVNFPTSKAGLALLGGGEFSVALPRPREGKQASVWKSVSRHCSGAVWRWQAGWPAGVRCGRASSHATVPPLGQRPSCLAAGVLKAVGGWGLPSPSGGFPEARCADQSSSGSQAALGVPHGQSPAGLARVCLASAVLCCAFFLLFSGWNWPNGHSPGREAGRCGHAGALWAGGGSSGATDLR